MNSANYNDIINTTTNVGTNGGPSHYGTYDQGGNAYEWTSTAAPTVSGQDYVVARGGRFVGRNASVGLMADYNHEFPPSQYGIGIGFRIASQGYGFAETSGVFDKNVYSDPLGLEEFCWVTDTGNWDDQQQAVYVNEVLEEPMYSGIVGRVDHDYLIGQYQVYVEQYCEFLNAVASTSDTYGIYKSLMSNAGPHGIIDTATVSGVTTYSPRDYCYHRPITSVRWYDALRYCNWLDNGKPSGTQSSSTTEDGAYPVSGLTTTDDSSIVMNSTNPNTGLSPSYWLPTNDEWHKAAYYQGHGTQSLYWTYPTQSDIPPLMTSPGEYNNGQYAMHKGGKTTTLNLLDSNSNPITLTFYNGLLIHAE